ncbi:Zinc finger matrin-type protein 2 [Thelohanellus kitauei]|uniref:Zinc finger matrin-type protein 2 n=1 Tax=Thelohanellus kitauei TaxID=669202 RepID=A0A0C2IXF2_THEKT|nr:Zinc finger matrin-type protein 2 [Thelohanellus kitauei]
MEDKPNPKGQNDNFRRTWNKNDYVPKPKPKLAKIKNEFSKADIVKKEKLKAREYLFDLDRMVGKTRVLKGATDSSSVGGYYCDVCQCTLNDSVNFLDHMNGIKHQKLLGMTMKIERSTVDQVKAKLERIKTEKQQKAEINELTFEERVERAKLAEQEEKKLKKLKKKQKKADLEERSEQYVDEETLKMMGFGSFAGK